MADKKISALTSATTPLAGTEVLPIVQSGTTVKVSVDNLTAGKTVSMTQLNVGNLSIATNTISSSTGTVTITPTSNQRISLNTTYAGSVGTLITNNSTSDGSAVQIASAATLASTWVLIDGYSSVNGTPTGIFRVRGDGVIYAQNTTVQSISDVRTKENIVDATDGLDLICALRPVRFDFKPEFGGGRKNQLGFIAQEMEAVFPDAVSEWAANDEIYKTVGPAALIPVLVKAIQELKAEIEILKAK